ncbi:MULTISPECIES: Fe-S cluster assembly protein SufD [unclassified Corynebacterium]|uniref:Fe-S cluster assembly protein SufD n=1 Tax=unclassified Corynebacterium TaxID=2624378 RepID=UPI002169F1D8|nr:MULTISPECIES: Fe-S cluster assembly protein SufD [unclassified Corynebacterium]MCS4489301.1 Fe-S cluster assembly protein SufD [Corynebacterium sp. ES2775-CONJ]MCS4491114.1 Fe-S cluster assembly protein SufD [Corynebacterium sp. ES2715-CONJ3]MCS4531005.1 Fe-S cluster assembly protein SufD [Corynebacterium sp. ES2730-CONJ]
MASTTEKNSTVHGNKGDIFSSTDVNEFEIPRGKDEVWRFVPLRRLKGLHDGSFAPVTDTLIDIAVPETATHVEVEKVTMDSPLIGRAGKPIDRISAQAFTSTSHATVVQIADAAINPEPISITITGAGHDVTTFSHVVIEVGEAAEATINLRYKGSGVHADNIEFIVGDNAKLNVIVDDSWDDDAVHCGSQMAVVGRDATLRHYAALFGGDLVRIVPRVRFTAPGGDAELLGVYFADSGQFFEQRLLVDHAQPNCTSNVLYKGALQSHSAEKRAEAHTAWVGDVLIRPNAQGTSTYEANRNLVLTEGGRADSVPNLEIETGEIQGAGHAATVGRFDDEQEFYLRSRGIPADEARRLIVRGFFSEVIGKIPFDPIREDLENRILQELETLRTLKKATS